jgi:hypothetical protein
MAVAPGLQLRDQRGALIVLPKQHFSMLIALAPGIKVERPIPIVLDGYLTEATEFA